jgi:hypothetical protein
VIAAGEGTEVRAHVVDGLLADASGVVDRALQGEPAALARTARALLLSLIGGAAAFGAAVGFYRGGVQVLYAALKLPLAVLVSAALSAPALAGLGAALGRPLDLRRDLLLVLTALARGGLVLAALAPVMLLAKCVSLDYHQTVVLLVGCCTTAGVAALPLLLRALWAEARGRLLLILAMVIVTGMAATQVSWMFRPYLVRPRSLDGTFLRSIDGSFSDSVSRSTSAAGGHYKERPFTPGGTP